MGSTKDILKLNSTTKYYIEYNGFLSNHISHGIIALHRLGAPPERIHRFVDWYKKRLEPENEHREASTGDVNDIIGKRQSYYRISEHYKKLLDQSDDDKSFIRDNLYKLRFGIAGSALHGLIHLGYGYSLGNVESIHEGMAYIHHSHCPLTVQEAKWTPFGSGKLSILEIIGLVKKDTELKKIMDDGSASDFWTQKKIGRFQSKVGPLLLSAGDRLVDYVNRLRYDAEVTDMRSAVALSEWLVDSALAVYCLSEKRNDFFLIHGVTGAWSLMQLISCFDDYEKATDMVRVYICVLLAVYMARGAPDLTVPLPDVDPNDCDFWKTTIEKATQEDRDEHIYKLIQVAHDMFTASPDNRQRGLYMAAARASLDNDLLI